MGKICDAREGDKEDQSALESTNGFCDLMNPLCSSQNLIEWKFMETSMEDGLLGRAALSRNESGWDQRDHYLKSFRWSQEDSSRLRNSTAADSDAEDHESSEIEPTEACDSSNEELEMVGSGFGSRKLRNQWKRDACFPPPLSSLMSKGYFHLSQFQMPCLQLQSIRSNGRFMLRQVKLAPQMHFQPIRTNNRLILQLIRPDKDNQCLPQQPQCEESAKEAFCSGKPIGLDGDGSSICKRRNEIHHSTSKISAYASALGEPERAIRKEEQVQELDFCEKSAKETNSKIDTSTDVSTQSLEDKGGKKDVAIGAVPWSFYAQDSAENFGINMAVNGKSSVDFDMLESVTSDGGWHLSVDPQRPKIVLPAPQNVQRLLGDGVGRLHASAQSFLQLSLRKVCDAVNELEALQQVKCKRYDLFNDEDRVLPIWERRCIASS